MLSDPLSDCLHCLCHSAPRSSHSTPTRSHGEHTGCSGRPTRDSIPPAIICWVAATSGGHCLFTDGGGDFAPLATQTSRATHSAEVAFSANIIVTLPALFMDRNPLLTACITIRTAAACGRPFIDRWHVPDSSGQSRAVIKQSGIER